MSLRSSSRDCDCCRCCELLLDSADAGSAESATAFASKPASAAERVRACAGAIVLEMRGCACAAAGELGSPGFSGELNADAKPPPWPTTPPVGDPKT